MAVRLKDVAEHAGVSVKTVSNVVHGFPFVAPATRLRVQTALDALGYRPNVSARSLRTGRTGLVGLALPRLHDPYFAEIAHAVVSAAATHGWTVLVEQTDGVRERELEVLTGSRPTFTDGMLCSPLALSHADLRGASPGLPIVLLGEHLGSGAADHVAIDNVAAARAATEHLLTCGRRRLAVVGAQPGPGGRTAKLRLRGFEQALAAAGLAADRSLVRRVAHFGRGEGAAAARDLLALPEPPDAIFCFNDLLAIGVLRTLHEAGVRVPDDVAVVGFDDIEQARFATPSLTTVAPDKQRIAVTALSRLDQRIEGEVTGPGQDLEVPFTLEVRESTVGR